jgi:hypothetical protein
LSAAAYRNALIANDPSLPKAEFAITDKAGGYFDRGGDGSKPGESVEAHGDLMMIIVRALLIFFVLIAAALAQTECPQSKFNTIYWLTTPDGIAHQQAGVDLGTTNTLFNQSRNWFSGPVNAPGILTVCRTTYFRDNGASAQSGKNAFVSINHLFGVGTSGANQDRALWITGATNGDSANYYGLETIQGELDINGSPNFIGSPDGEASVASFQVEDAHVGTIPGPTNFGVNGLRVTYFREAGAGSWGSSPPAAARFRVSNLSAVPANGAALFGIMVNATDVAAGDSNVAGVGVNIGSPLHDFTGHRFPSYNWGLFVSDFGSNTADYNINSQSLCPNCGRNLFEGMIIANSEIRTGKTTNTDLAGVGVIPFTMMFNETYSVPPVCTASETTALNLIMVQATRTGLTVSGTEGDSFAYICVGRN